MLRSIGYALGAAILISCTLFAQPAFEVASVKPDNSGTGVDRIKISGGSLIIQNVSLKRIISIAYGIPESREYLLSGPDWMASENFDISAKSPETTPEADLLRMLQRLLAGRFNLTVHHESKEVAGYALVVGKAGPKLQPSQSTVWMFRANPGHATGSGVTMAAFADRISRPPFELDRPVADFTGLTGAFNVTLDWRPGDSQAESTSGASIFTAIEEQLGLRLESRKLTLDGLIVDRVDKTPTAN